MSEYYKNYRQSKFTAWIWFAVIIMSAIIAFISMYNGNWQQAFDQAIFGMIVYRLDKTEKHITAVNNERDGIK